MPHARPLPPTLTDPRPLLRSGPLSPSAHAWLGDALARVAARPTAIRALFPAARRHCGQARLDAHWTADEAARAALLTALPLRGRALADEVKGLYRHGDPAEQRAVLRALPLLDAADAADAADAVDTGADTGGEDLVLVLLREALRGNDTTVIESALGPYGAARLPAAEYRQAVLKCLFCEIPLDHVAGLDVRADHELARMLVDFAHERIAAGRDVPPDVWPLVRAFPAVATTLATRARDLAPTRPEAAARALAALAVPEKPKEEA
ncbi:EboA domain-containing protein [Streptomyces sp. NPDC048751]|uniref:EboA domain-containing protein n=1 Tax=Streptomyces sp. NPDC048751 TaxID=3365591 RepID=UPI003718B95B